MKTKNNVKIQAGIDLVASAKRSVKRTMSHARVV